MAIKLAEEQVIGFREAAGLLPRRRRGRKPHVSTLYRWRDQGLETIQIGGTLCTSVEALERFFQSRTITKEAPPVEHRTVTSPVKAERDQRYVEQDLSSFGL